MTRAAGSGRLAVVVRIAMAGVLLWSLYGFARGVRRAERLATLDSWHVEAPVSWPRDGRHVARVEGVLQQGAARVPPGARVVVHVASGMAEGQGFYLTRWAAYLWPDRDVLWAAGSPVEGPIDAWLVHGGPPAPAQREVVAASGELRLLVPEGER